MMGHRRQYHNQRYSSAYYTLDSMLIYSSDGGPIVMSCEEGYPKGVLESYHQSLQK